MEQLFSHNLVKNDLTEEIITALCSILATLTILITFLLIFRNNKFDKFFDFFIRGNIIKFFKKCQKIKILKLKSRQIRNYLPSTMMYDIPFLDYYFQFYGAKTEYFYAENEKKTFTKMLISWMPSLITTWLKMTTQLNE